MRCLAHFPRNLLLQKRQLSSVQARAHVSRASGATPPGDVPHAASAPILPSSVTLIVSASNPYVKHCVKLRTSARYRQEAGRCLLVGRGLLEEALGDVGEMDVRALFVSAAVSPHSGDPDLNPQSPGVSMKGIKASSTVLVTESVLKKLTGLDCVDGIDLVAELDLPKSVDFSQSGLGPQRLLALDAVQDPGNLGTLLRTALAFGWDGVFLLPGCADPFGDKAIRASRGAALRVPIGRGDLGVLRRIVEAKRLVMLAAEPEPEEDPVRDADKRGGKRGKDVGQVDFLSASPRVCLVLGSEGQGLSQDVREACAPVAIPMVGLGSTGGTDGTVQRGMESLNVGVAGGILMFMLSRGLPHLITRLRGLVGLREDPAGESDRTKV